MQELVLEGGQKGDCLRIWVLWEDPKGEKHKDCIEVGFPDIFVPQTMAVSVNGRRLFKNVCGSRYYVETEHIIHQSIAAAEHYKRLAEEVQSASIFLATDHAAAARTFFMIAEWISQGMIDGALISGAMAKRLSPEAIVCDECGGKGVTDSGGQNPDGSWVNIPCGICKGRGLLPNPKLHSDRETMRSA